MIYKNKNKNLNQFFTDEAGNLYDQNQNLIAYEGQYQIDQNGNISILKQNQQNNQQLNSQLNTQLNNKNFSKKKNNVHKKENYLDLLLNISGGKKDENHHENGIQEKNNTISFENKFPSELNPSEDFVKFLGNIKNISKIFEKNEKLIKNKARWKLIFIGKSETVEFLDQLSVLLDSGIRLVDSVVIMKKQAKSYGMKILLGSLAEKMGNGMHLSEALEDYNFIFPEKWIQMIKAAEKSGKMSEVLTDLAKEEISQMQFVSKIKGAMIYPGILILMAMLVFWGMMKYMVPSLEKSFGNIENLPALTQKIISISHYMQDNMLTIILYPIIFFGILFFLNSQFVTMKKIINFIGLRLPIFGKISKMKNIVIFADNLVLMLSSGVIVSKSLTIVAETMPSILYQKEVHKIRRGINDGYNISEMMGLSGKMDNNNTKENFYFGLEIAQMIKIGEETGNTLGVLKKISEVNTNKLENIVRNLTSMLEPIITIIIGGMVGTLIIAFMIPMMSSFKNVG